MFEAIVRRKLLRKINPGEAPHWAVGSPAEWTLTEWVAENKSGQFYLHSTPQKIFTSVYRI